MDKARNSDVAMIVEAFGLLDFGSQPLWMALGNQVTKRINNLKLSELSKILIGF